MNPSDIKPGDWRRILIGEVPGEFYIELLIRGTFLYVLLLVCMRLLGKRMSAQLNRNELAALVSLAAAIGVSIQAPDRGLLPAIVVAGVMILISRGISMLIYYSPKAEKISQGNYAELVHDGVLQLKTMAEVRITRERLFSLLRERGIRQLGEVRRLYFEAGAKFTLVKQDEQLSGLPVLPEWDDAFLQRQQADPARHSCHSCGTTRPAGQQEVCPECGNRHWITAII